jgi:hypothetical protein
LNRLRQVIRIVPHGNNTLSKGARPVVDAPCSRLEFAGEFIYLDVNVNSLSEDFP